MPNTTVTATGYKNTGYNSINVPDTPDLLESLTKVEFPAMDIINIRYLSSIKVKVTNGTALSSGDTESYVENIDYMKLTKGDKNAYYAVVGYEPTSYDVYTFFVVYDPWLTNGGTALIGSNNVLDGMTVRHHVAKADDKFAKFCEKDDMLIPSEPLRLEHKGYKVMPDPDNQKQYVLDADKCVFLSGTTFDGHAFDSTSKKMVRSSLDLSNMGSDSDIEWNTYEIEDITAVAYPKVKPLSGQGVNVYVPSGFFSSPGSGQQTYKCVPSITMEPYQKYFEANNYTVSQGIAQARSMGVENSISASWAVPNGYVIDYSENQGTINRIEGLSMATDLKFNGSDVYRYKYAVKNDDDSTYTPNNLRIFYGEYNKYCLTAIATGNHTEYLPEELYGNLDGTIPSSPGTSTPYLGVCVDPRAEGRPYFNYLRLKDAAMYGSDTEVLNFYNGCVAGMEWAESPIQYTTISGKSFKAANATLDIDYSYGTSDFFSRILNAGGVGNYAGISASSVTGMMTSSYGAGFGTNSKGEETFNGNPLSKIASVAQNGLSAGTYSLAGAFDDLFGTNVQGSDWFAGMNKEAAADKIRERQKDYEVAKFKLNNNQPVSVLAFPFTPTLRDATTNGCAAYRYRPTDKDLKKFDTVLNMYGYKITEPIKAEHFTNRNKYNYLQVAGISFGQGVVNNRDRDMLANMFATGIRIWHVQPDATLYTGTNNA